MARTSPKYAHPKMGRRRPLRGPLVPREREELRRSDVGWLIANPLWGRLGHYKVNLVAALAAGPEFPDFFRSGSRTLESLSYEPDRMKFAGAQSRFSVKADHFLNLESVEARIDLDEYPTRTSLGRVYHDDAQLKPSLGFLHLAITETYQRLSFAFAQWRVRAGELKGPTGKGMHAQDLAEMDDRSLHARILYYAGVLGHFVADAAQPLHVTDHHNGRVDDRVPRHEGIHSHFETRFLDRYLHDPTPILDALHPPVVLTEPVLAAALAFIRRSHAEVDRLYDLADADAFATGAAEPAAEGWAFAVDRLAAGSQFLLNLWLTARRDPSYFERWND